MSKLKYARSVGLGIGLITIAGGSSYAFYSFVEAINETKKRPIVRHCGDISKVSLDEKLEWLVPNDAIENSVEFFYIL